MPVILHCQQCGLRRRAADKYAGKLVRCPSCKQPVRVAGAKNAPSLPGKAETELRKNLAPSPNIRPEAQRKKTEQRPKIRELREDEVGESTTRMLDLFFAPADAKEAIEVAPITGKGAGAKAVQPASSKLPLLLGFTVTILLLSALAFFFKEPLANFFKPPEKLPIDKPIREDQTKPSYALSQFLTYLRNKDVKLLKTVCTDAGWQFLGGDELRAFPIGRFEVIGGPSVAGDEAVFQVKYMADGWEDPANGNITLRLQGRIWRFQRSDLQVLDYASSLPQGDPDTTLSEIINALKNDVPGLAKHCSKRGLLFLYQKGNANELFLQKINGPEVKSDRAEMSLQITTPRMSVVYTVGFYLDKTIWKFDGLARQQIPSVAPSSVPAKIMEAMENKDISTLKMLCNPNIYNEFESRFKTEHNTSVQTYIEEDFGKAHDGSQSILVREVTRFPPAVGVKEGKVVNFLYKWTLASVEGSVRLVSRGFLDGHETVAAKSAMRAEIQARLLQIENAIRAGDAEVLEKYCLDHVYSVLANEMKEWDFSQFKVTPKKTVQESWIANGLLMQMEVEESRMVDNSLVLESTIWEIRHTNTSQGWILFRRGK